jgi:Ca2+-dependent lipid-binding protein
MANKLNFKSMSDILYILAVILIIGWLLGYFVFSVGAIIHVLLVVAVIAILLRLIRGRSV